MINAQKNEINAKKIGYMSYNKLNVFMTTLLLGFSITFAILGDRVNISNIFTSMGVWPWRNIGIIFGITLASILVPYAAGIICFKLGLCYELGLKIKNNPIIIATIISIISIGGIGHWLLPEIGAYILDGILGFILFYIGYKNLTEIHQITLQFGISLSALIGLLGLLGILLFNYIQNKVTK